MAPIACFLRDILYSSQKTNFVWWLKDTLCLFNQSLDIQHWNFELKLTLSIPDTFRSVLNMCSFVFFFHFLYLSFSPLFSWSCSLTLPSSLEEHRAIMGHLFSASFDQFFSTLTPRSFTSPVVVNERARLSCFCDADAWKHLQVVKSGACVCTCECVCALWHAKGMWHRTMITPQLHDNVVPRLLGLRIVLYMSIYICPLWRWSKWCHTNQWQKF